MIHFQIRLAAESATDVFAALSILATLDIVEDDWYTMPNKTVIIDGWVSREAVSKLINRREFRNCITLD